MEGGVRESSVIPDSVMDSVNRTLANVEDVQTHLLNFLSLYDPHVLSQMPPLQRAQTLLTLAKATTTLFTCAPTPPLPPSLFLFFFFFFLFVNSLKGLIFGFCFWFLFFYSEVEVYWSSPRWPSSKIRACRFAHTVNLCLFLCFLSCGYLCFEVWVLCIFLWYLGVTVWVFLTCRFWLMGIASSMWFLFSCWSIHVGGDQLIIWNYMLCLLVLIAWELIFFHYPCIVGKIKFVWGQTWKAHRLE